MKVKEALTEGRRRLHQDTDTEAELEGELLLRHILGIDLTELYLRHDDSLTPDCEHAYFALIERRLAGEPSAYLIGQREFYGFKFYVNKSVLIPRPETELLVTETISIARNNPKPVIADIGTGSGAIAVTLARHLPEAKIYAVDISGEALQVAQDNARRHPTASAITFLEGNLLAPLPEAADIIAANLPYVRSDELPHTGEPLISLDGGRDGLDVIARLIQEAPSKLKPGASVLLEIGLRQAAEVVHLLCLALPRASVQIINDLAGIPRVVRTTMLS